MPEKSLGPKSANSVMSVTPEAGCLIFYYKYPT